MPDLTAWKKQFDGMLLKIHKEYCGNQLEAGSPDHMSKFLDAIDFFATNAYESVFGAQQHSMLRGWLAESVRAGIDSLVGGEWPLGIIEYEGSLEKFIPLDYLFLPLPGYRYIRNPKNTSEWIMSLCQVLGFGFIVQRNPAGHHHRSCSMTLGDRLSVDVFADDRLANQQREADFFRINDRHFDIREYHPGARTETTAEVLADTLVSRRHVQLDHFICHCDSHHEDVLQHSLSFGSQNVSISLGDLRRHVIAARVISLTRSRTKKPVKPSRSSTRALVR